MGAQLNCSCRAGVRPRIPGFWRSFQKAGPCDQLLLSFSITPKSCFELWLKLGFGFRTRSGFSRWCSEVLPPGGQLLTFPGQAGVRTQGRADEFSLWLTLCPHPGRVEFAFPLQCLFCLESSVCFVFLGDCLTCS